MFGISIEHFLIVGVILLVVGPRRLPELGNSLGKAMKNFKDSISGVEQANYKRVEEKEKAEVLKKEVAAKEPVEAEKHS